MLLWPEARAGSASSGSRLSPSITNGWPSETEDFRQIDTCKLRRGREDVDELHQGIALRIGLSNVRPSDDEGDANAALVDGCLRVAFDSPRARQAAFHAVVRGEHHNRVVCDIQPIERSKNLPDAVVDHLNGAIGGSYTFT